MAQKKLSLPIGASFKLALLVFPAIIIIAIAGGALMFQNRIVNSKVLGVHITRVSKQEAADSLASRLAIQSKITINIETNDGVKQFNVPTNLLGLKADYFETAENAYNHTRTGTLSDQIDKTLQSLARPTNVPLAIYYSKGALDEQLSLIAEQVYVQPQYPDVNVGTNGIDVNKGTLGWELDINDLKSKIDIAIKTLSDEQISVAMTQVGQELSDGEVLGITANFEQMEGKSVILTFEGFEYKLQGEELMQLVHNINGTDKSSYDLVATLIAEEINREPVNPIFTINNDRVEEFTPSIDGIKLNREEFLRELSSGVEDVKNTEVDSVEIMIPVLSSKPDIQTSEINNYGIKELIGVGESDFRGSIPNRVHNVGVAAEKLNGILVAPGDIFSFNEAVGDISVFTGYKQSYIIQGNQTVLGDGGGVCQVSTTLFRAAMDAGLPIVERRPHSYRVGYYEQGSPPGLDATIYSPTVDLKIKNDTPAHILIQTKYNEATRSLDFEFYGTSDGRVSNVTKPVVYDVTEPPEDLFIDDPTKPTGHIEQIDWKAWGAKVSYDYTVERDGETIFEKTFFSNYRPWQAKFVRGTGPAI